MIKIDSKNSIKSYTDIDIKDLKAILFQKLSDLEEIDTTVHQIQYLKATYFSDQKMQKIIDEVPIISKFYTLTLYFALKLDKDIQCSIFDVLNLLNKIDKDTLTLSYPNIKTISLFLAKYVREFNDKLKITKEAEFLQYFSASEVIEEAKSKNCDLFFEEQAPLSMDKTLKKELKSVYDKIKDLNNKSKERSDKHKKKMKYRFPEGFKLVCDSFKTVKLITFEIPNEKDSPEVMLYLIVLLNLEWLFKDLKGIKLDLQIPFMNSQYYHIKKKHLNNEEISQYKTYQDVSIVKIIENNTKLFEVFLFIPLFVSFIQKDLESLSVLLPESYTYELIQIMKAKGITPKDFNVLINFDKDYKTIGIAFNTLNSKVFQRLFVAINGDNCLRNLAIDMFPEDSFYSMYAMIKCLQETRTTFEDSQQSQSKKILNSEYIIDNNESITGLLFAPFENNLEFFLYLIERKFHLFYIVEFKFDLPGIFYLNDKFINTLHKFFLSLFSIMSKQMIEKNITVFTIRSSNFILETRKYPEINTFMKENIDLRKIARLSELHLEIAFHEITSINLLIPFSVEKLYLGEMDNKTFESFINNLSYLNKIRLLHLGFNSLHYDIRISDNAMILNKLIKCDKPGYLTYIDLEINFYIDATYLNMFISSIKEENAKGIIRVYRIIISCNNCSVRNKEYAYTKKKMVWETAAFAIKKRSLNSNKSQMKILKSLYSYVSDIYIKIK